MSAFLKYFGFGILLVIPFILHKAHPDSPTELPKLLYGTLLILLFTIFWLVDFWRKQQITLKWSHSLSCLSLIVMANLVSYLFSISPYISFWGEKALPSDSVLSLLVFLLFSVLMFQIFDPKKDFKKLFLIFVIILVLQITLGFIQRHALILTWFSNSIVYGTIGVTVGFATFLGCLMPLLLTQLFNVQSKLTLLAIAALMTLVNLMMFYASSRTPTVVNILMTTAIALLFLYLRPNKTTLKKTAVVFATFFLAYGYFKYDVVRPELNQKFQGKMINKAFSSRMLIWSNAITAWKKNPLIGSGPESFLIIQRPLQDLNMNRYEYWNEGWPKAHNHILQILACTGLFGLLSHLLLLGYMSFEVFRGLRNKQDAPDDNWGRALYGTYIYLFIANLTCFNFIPTQILCFLFPALFGLTLGSRHLKVKTIQLPLRFKSLLVLLFAIPTLSLANSTYNYSMGNIYHHRGLRKLNIEKKYTEAINDYYTGLTYNEDEPFLYCQIAYAIANILKNNTLATKAAEYKSPTEKITLLTTQEKQDAIKKIDENLEICVEKGQKKAHFYYVRANLYGRMFFETTIGPERAFESYRFLINYLPVNPENHLMIGVVYLRNNQEAEFIQSMNRAIELKNDYLPAYIELLNYYYRTEKYDEVDKLVDRVDLIEFYSEQNIHLIKDLIELSKKAKDLRNVKILLLKYGRHKNQFL